MRRSHAHNSSKTFAMSLATCLALVGSSCTYDGGSAHLVPNVVHVSSQRDTTLRIVGLAPYATLVTTPDGLTLAPDFAASVGGVPLVPQRATEEGIDVRLEASLAIGSYALSIHARGRTYDTPDALRIVPDDDDASTGTSDAGTHDAAGAGDARRLLDGSVDGSHVPADGSAGPDDGARDGGSAPDDAGDRDAESRVQHDGATLAPIDAGNSPPADAGGSAETDAGGSAETDAGAPPLDAGSDSGTDAGAPPVDAGTDAGAPPVDAGSDAAADAGAPPVDAGSDSGADAGPMLVGSVPNGAVVTALASGDDFTCALRFDGSVVCWGDNDTHQLGSAGATGPTPRLVPLALPATAITAGAAFACAELDDASIFCWGANDRNQGGRGAASATQAPRQVGGISANRLPPHAGDAHGCLAVPHDDTVWCWGANASGQTGVTGLGLGHPDPTPTPQRVGLLPSAVVLLSAGGDTTCGTFGTSVYCWGRGTEGELGNGLFLSSALSVRALLPLVTTTSLSVGARSVCAIADRLRCWGDNTDGQLGDGSRTRRLSPVDSSSGLTDFVAVDVGTTHACAIRSGGQLRCWGSNASGELGLGTVSGTDVLTATTVSAIAPVRAVALGRSHSCALHTSGAVSCWGRATEGQIGVSGAARGTPETVMIPAP